LVDSDAAQVRELIVHVRQIVDRIPALIVVPAHDARVWRRVPKH
jgi:hypothetical protein